MKLESSYKPYINLNSKNSVNLSRIRMGLSGLNYQRWLAKFIKNKSCDYCHGKKEDPSHFFLSCPQYSTQRVVLMEALGPILPDDLQHLIPPHTPKYKTILCNIIINGTGKEIIDLKIFDIVSKFITNSNRF